MTKNQDDQYNHYVKIAWIIYILLTITVIAVLVLFIDRTTKKGSSTG